MIDINLYRIRIGTFSPKSSDKKLKFMNMFGTPRSATSGRLLLNGIKSVLKVILIFTLLNPTLCYQSQACYGDQKLPLATKYCSTQLAAPSPQSGLTGAPWLGTTQSEIKFQVRGRRETQNFLAKYTNGTAVMLIISLSW